MKVRSHGVKDFAVVIIRQLSAAHETLVRFACNLGNSLLRFDFLKAR